MTERGDPGTFFSGSLEANLDSLYAVAVRLTRNPADAEDLVAESAAKAWAALGSLDDRARFRPWLFRILHNCFVTNYRRRAIRPDDVPYDDVPCGEQDDEIASMLVREPDGFLTWWANPERNLSNTFLGKDIMAAIDSLPDAYRTAVLLVNVDGLSYDEAAEVLGVSPGTIRSRMNRGRTLLQKALWQHACDAGLISKQDNLEHAT